MDCHCEHVEEIDRILRGNGGAGLQERVRGLAWLPDAVRGLQARDVMQGALTDAAWKLGMTAATVLLTVIVTRLFT